MRTFIIRARKGSTRWDKVRSLIGTAAHFEVVAHSIINAFFISSDFRPEVEVYVVLDSSEDFPRTLHLSSKDGLSLAGFHEEAIVQLFEQALKHSEGLSKDSTCKVAPGVSVLGFGFEKLVSQLLLTRPLFILDIKGEDIEQCNLPADPVFILSDHLMMPKKSLQGLKRKGVSSLRLGKKMLFASQCIVLLHHTLDGRNL